MTVTLVLLDYNDNSPQFLDAPYSFTVNEVNYSYDMVDYNY